MMSPGHLVYGAGDGVLMAMPFDGSKRRVLGEPVPVLSGMQDGGGIRLRRIRAFAMGPWSISPAAINSTSTSPSFRQTAKSIRFHFLAGNTRSRGCRPTEHSWRCRLETR